MERTCPKQIFAACEACFVRKFCASKFSFHKFQNVLSSWNFQIPKGGKSIQPPICDSIENSLVYSFGEGKMYWMSKALVNFRSAPTKWFYWLDVNWTTQSTYLKAFIGTLGLSAKGSLTLFLFSSVIPTTYNKEKSNLANEGWLPFYIKSEEVAIAKILKDGHFNNCLICQLQ